MSWFELLIEIFITLPAKLFLATCESIYLAFFGKTKNVDGEIVLITGAGKLLINF
jgi:type I restriction-modification system DNA methylase subunit